MADTATHSGAMKIVYPKGMKLPLRHNGHEAPESPAEKQAAKARQKHRSKRRRLTKKRK